MHKFHCTELDFKICISQSIVDELFSHRQTHCFSKESGGMLFSNNLTDSEIEINKITTPGSTDLRKRNYFKLDEKKAKEDIISLFKQGFHYLGDWHTHNEGVASPSGTDIRSIQDLFIKSGHTRPFFSHANNPKQRKYFQLLFISSRWEKNIYFQVYFR